MPNCFALTRIGDKEPTSLDLIDRELCQTFELEYSSRVYTYGWFDDIGFQLAMGRSWDVQVDALKKDLEGPDNQFRHHEWMMLSFIHHLRQFYSPDAWAER